MIGRTIGMVAELAGERSHVAPGRTYLDGTTATDRILRTKPTNHDPIARSAVAARPSTVESRGAEHAHQATIAAGYAPAGNVLDVAIGAAERAVRAGAPDPERTARGAATAYLRAHGHGTTPAAGGSSLSRELYAPGVAVRDRDCGAAPRPSKADKARGWLRAAASTTRAATLADGLHAARRDLAAATRAAGAAEHGTNADRRAARDALRAARWRARWEVR